MALRPELEAGLAALIIADWLHILCSDSQNKPGSSTTMLSISRQRAIPKTSQKIKAKAEHRNSCTDTKDSEDWRDFALWECLHVMCSAVVEWRVSVLHWRGGE